MHAYRYKYCFVWEIFRKRPPTLGPSVLKIFLGSMRDSLRSETYVSFLLILCWDDYFCTQPWIFFFTLNVVVARHTHTHTPDIRLANARSASSIHCICYNILEAIRG